MTMQIGSTPATESSSPSPSEIHANLTRRQQEILAFIQERIAIRGYGPTIREIGAHFEIKSPNGVACHLRALEKKGAIQRESHLARAIRLSQASSQRSKAELPFAGHLAVGETYSMSHQQEQLDFAGLFAVPENTCLRLAQAHLLDGHFVDGDVLVMRMQNSFRDGELVLFFDDRGDMGIGRPYRETYRIRLESPGKTVSPRFVRRIDVVGVVVALIRSY